MGEGQGRRGTGVVREGGLGLRLGVSYFEY